MRNAWISAALAAAVSIGAAVALSGTLPKGYLDEKASGAILEKTVTVRLDPDLSQLSQGERGAVGCLLQAGEIMGQLYEDSRHRQARAAYEQLALLDKDLGHPQATRNLIDLYRLAKGPQIRDLTNKAVTFLPVEPTPPGKAVYPWGVEKKEIEEFLREHPEAESQILHTRTVVRRTVPIQISADITTLSTYPVLGVLHPGLREYLGSLAVDPSQQSFYAVPYSVEYAPYLMRVYDLLWRASSAVEKDDEEFARFLRNRAIDLLRDDYEGGDASWVTGRFHNLDAQIGSYETYDDALFGVKSFFGMSVMVRDAAMTAQTDTVKAWLQEMEDLLPYGPHKRVRTDIPIGAYNVIADFGQARGTNTATILPNESYLTRRYGRTILLRNNIITSPEIAEMRTSTFRAAVGEDFHRDYDGQGDFHRTLWHEIGHYLGPDATQDGAILDAALEEDASILEELKADLVALHVSTRLREKGYYDEARQRSVRAAGIHRILLVNEPKKSQAYQTMELMQMNYFLEKGLLDCKGRGNKLAIHYERYDETVETMLREVLSLQLAGDKAAADAFISKYSVWQQEPHARLAKAIKAAEKYRYVLVRYAALQE